MKKEEMVIIFKAFSDESRLSILGLLKDGEMCGNDILEKMKISQSTLSHHMKLLCESGVVVGRRQGKWMYYSISAMGAETAAKMMQELLDAKVSQAAPAAKKPATKKAEVKKPEVKKAEPVVEDKKPEPDEKKERPAQRRQPDVWLL